MHCDDYDDDNYDDDIFGQNKNRCEADGDYGNESPSLSHPYFASVPSLSFSLSLSLWGCPYKKLSLFNWLASLFKVVQFHFLHSSAPHRKLLFKWQVSLVKVFFFHFHQGSFPYNTFTFQKASVPSQSVSLSSEQCTAWTNTFGFIMEVSLKRYYFHFSNGKRP